VGNDRGRGHPLPDLLDRCQHAGLQTDVVLAARKPDRRRVRRPGSKEVGVIFTDLLVGAALELAEVDFAQAFVESDLEASLACQRSRRLDRSPQRARIDGGEVEAANRRRNLLYVAQPTL